MTRVKQNLDYAKERKEETRKNNNLEMTFLLQFRELFFGAYYEPVINIRSLFFVFLMFFSECKFVYDGLTFYIKRIIFRNNEIVISEYHTNIL